MSSERGENTRRNASVRVVWKRPERFPPEVLVARFGGRGMASRPSTSGPAPSMALVVERSHGAREGRTKGQLTLVSARGGGSYLVRVGEFFRGSICSGAATGFASSSVAAPGSLAGGRSPGSRRGAIVVRGDHTPSASLPT